MPRKSRETSVSSIYHVMLRGINKQVIFESNDDYWKFIRLMYRLIHPIDETGYPLSPHCGIYAYCLMSNHVHLLIKDIDNSLASTIKGMTIPYAQYFNKKYDRVGHFFQDRFKSEPVNDWDYFVTLLRYIHQNPVAAGLTKDVSKYTWSSWREYSNPASCRMPLCATEAVLSKITIDELTGLVNLPLPKTQMFLDYNYDPSIKKIEDETIIDCLIELCGSEDYFSVIENYSPFERCELIRKLREIGGSIRQIARITGISESLIRRIK